MKILSQRFDASPKHARNFLQVEAEEIFYLRAGDQDGYAVCEPDNDGPRNILYRCAHPGKAHDDENHSGHHCEHEQAFDAMNGYDAAVSDPNSSRGRAHW